MNKLIFLLTLMALSCSSTEEKQNVKEHTWGTFRKSRIVEKEEEKKHIPTGEKIQHHPTKCRCEEINKPSPPTIGISQDPNWIWDEENKQWTMKNE